MANAGDVVWDRNSVDYLYFSGARIYLQELYDLPINVLPNRQVDLVVKMQAPNNRGTYVTTWVMRIGDEIFCNMEQRITTY